MPYIVTYNVTPFDETSNTSFGYVCPVITEAMERVRTFLGVDKWSHWETDPFPHDDHLGTINKANEFSAHFLDHPSTYEITYISTPLPPAIISTPATTQMSDDPDCVFKHVPKLDCDFRDLLAEHYADQNKSGPLVYLPYTVSTLYYHLSCTQPYTQRSVQTYS